MTPLDPRLTGPGLATSVETLVAVFADHYRGVPAAMICPGCGHRFTGDDDTADCPTNSVARPLLVHRQHESPTALTRLNPGAFDNLRHIKPKPKRAKTSVRPPVTGDLFDVTPFRRYPRKDGQ